MKKFTQTIMLFACLGVGISANAGPIEIQNNSFVFRDFLDVNPYPFFQDQDRLVFSAKVNVNVTPTYPGDPPDPNDPPTVTRDSPITQPNQIPFKNDPATPNNYSEGFAWNPILAAQNWTYTAVLGGDSDQRTVPALPQDIINTPVMLSTDARINGDGDVTWTPSPDTRVNHLTIDILAGPDGLVLNNGRVVEPGRIVVQSRRSSVLHDPATSTFNLSDLSDPNKFRNLENYQPAVNDQFVIRLRYEIRDFNRTDENGQRIGTQISRSSKFISVNVPPPGAPDVFLPTIDENGVYNFDVEVVGGDLFFFDPEFATGFDYIIDSGPNFGSVLIPGSLPGGDSLFDLLVPGFATIPLFAGIAFDFKGLNPFGFSSFGIRGIDVAEYLDPTDPLAFVTGLTFVGDGQVMMRMTPVTTSVPEPATLALFGLGLAGLGFARKKRKSA